MAVPSPKTWTDGTIPLASEFNSNIKDAINFFKTPDRVQVRNTADLTTANNTWVLTTWNTDVTDLNTMHDTGSNTSRLVAKTAGRYYVYANVQWEDHLVSAFDGTRGMQIRKNSAGAVGTGTMVGTDQRHSQQSLVGSVGGGQCNCDGYVSLAVNDYVELFVYEGDNDGGAGCIMDMTRYNACRFSMHWVST